MVWEPDGKCGLKIEEIKSSRHHVYGVIGNKENSIIGNIENSKIENTVKLSFTRWQNYHQLIFIYFCLFLYVFLFKVDLYLVLTTNIVL